MQKKALVIDDTKNIRLLLTKCLELEDWNVLSAADGKEGLELIRENSFDLVFLDIKLPEISGTEVLRQMRRAGITTPVIAITAYPTIKNAVDCTRLGVVSYLQKPFTAERLRNVLADLNLPISGEPSQRQMEIESALHGGDLAKAKILLGQALSDDPADRKLYILLSKVYHAMGDGENADKFRQIAEYLK